MVGGLEVCIFQPPWWALVIGRRLIRLVYRWVFLNVIVEHVEQLLYIVIVPAARVVVGIVGDCPHCSNAPQCLNLSERWDPKERRKQQFSCVPFQRETWQCWHASAQGQVGGLWTQMRIVFTFSNREQPPLKSLSRCLPESSQGVQPCLPEIIWLV